MTANWFKGALGDDRLAVIGDLRNTVGVRSAVADDPSGMPAAIATIVVRRPMGSTVRVYEFTVSSGPMVSERDALEILPLLAAQVQHEVSQLRRPLVKVSRRQARRARRNL